MPDWDRDELKKLKETVIKYLKSINEKDYAVMNEIFSENIVINISRCFGIGFSEELHKKYFDKFPSYSIE